MSKKGIIAVISGFSGAGKGTVVNELIEKYGYAVSISATTRKPREGEVEGKSYFFKTKEEFEEMIEKDELIEYAQYVDNYYGTPKDYVLSQVEQGKDVLLEIEMQGALKVKEKFPEVSLIFITPPSVGELRRRLQKRGTETEEVIEKRIARAKEECAYMQEYDYIVENAGLEECVEQMHALLQSIHLSKNNQQALIKTITEDFDQ
ncbi:MAG: guanylate kinase [Butyribacter sp.]|nr:guanylate kinase [bacterium]MDY3853426.1 guanylate kinase [Butyribacter sp.]